jgi:peroxiredoxin/mono/diheme cytochrome c family protein
MPAPWLLLAVLMAPDAPIADFTLLDAQGVRHTLSTHAAGKPVVIAFLGADCPLANRYATRLGDLAREYQPRGVAFLGIDSNQQDALARLAQMAKAHRLDFPLLKDPGNVVADQLGAARTPEVFVLDAGRVVRYRGRIDDQFGVGFARPRPTRRDLAEALDELLAGKPVSTPVTEAPGCRISRVRRGPGHGDVTYTRHVAAILNRRCVACHHDGAMAPFALTSYADAAAWAETIAEVVRDGRMPPWDASPQHGTFANDPSLTDAERQTLAAWVQSGVPEGDPKDLPQPPTLAVGWQIPKPDLVVTMPKPFNVPAKGVVRYQYVTVDPGFTEDKWVQATEARAGNPSVVHHIVVFIHAPGTPSPAERGIGEIIAVGVPGMAALIHPPGVARLVPAGSKLVFQMHYTPNGVAQADQSRLGLVFADPRTVRKQVKSDMAVNFQFKIPPGAPDHALTANYRFGQDTVLFALFPHMHLRGKSFRMEAVYPDKRREVLLEVPRYRFDWQNQYVFKEPKLLPEGTVLHCEGHFDNSTANLSNPDPKRVVTFGEQTWDEMMVGYFDMALAAQDLRERQPAVRPLDGGKHEVTFRYQAPAGTKAVFLAGSFNGWKPDGHRMDGPDAEGRFTTRLELPAGKHEYKFVLDGKVWRHDPGNPHQAGHFHNSLLVLPARAKE